MESRTREENFDENRRILTSVISMSFSFIGSIASCSGVSCGSVAFSLHFREVSLPTNYHTFAETSLKICRLKISGPFISSVMLLAIPKHNKLLILP